MKHGDGRRGLSQEGPGRSLEGGQEGVLKVACAASVHTTYLYMYSMSVVHQLSCGKSRRTVNLAHRQIGSSVHAAIVHLTPSSTPARQADSKAPLLIHSASHVCTLGPDQYLTESTVTRPRGKKNGLPNLQICLLQRRCPPLPGIRPPWSRRLVRYGYGTPGREPELDNLCLFRRWGKMDISRAETQDQTFCARLHVYSQYGR